MNSRRLGLFALFGALFGALVVTLGARLAAADEPKYDLRYKFTPGEVVRSEVVHKAIVDTNIKGTSQTAKTRSTSVKVWKIVGVDAEGHIKIEHSVESVDMWQKVQGRQEVRYNSASDETPPPGYEEAAKAVGVPLTRVTIDDRGKILERETLHAQPGASAEQMTLLLPEGPVAIGHVWNRPLEMDVALQPQGRKRIQAREQYTLSKVEGDIATIEIDTQVLTPINDPQIESQLVQRLPKGTAEFNIRTGCVVSQDLEVDRRVLEISGPSSVMHYLTRYHEKLLIK